MLTQAIIWSIGVVDFELQQIDYWFFDNTLCRPGVAAITLLPDGGVLFAGYTPQELHAISRLRLVGIDMYYPVPSTWPTTLRADAPI